MVFVNKENLVKHMKQNDKAKLKTPSTKKQQWCTFCRKSISNAANFKKHMRIVHKSQDSHTAYYQSDGKEMFF